MRRLLYEIACGVTGAIVGLALGLAVVFAIWG